MEAARVAASVTRTLSVEHVAGEGTCEVRWTYQQETMELIDASLVTYVAREKMCGGRSSHRFDDGGACAVLINPLAGSLCKTTMPERSK